MWINNPNSQSSYDNHHNTSTRVNLETLAVPYIENLRTDDYQFRLNPPSNSNSIIIQKQLNQSKRLESKLRNRQQRQSIAANSEGLLLSKVSTLFRVTIKPCIVHRFYRIRRHFRYVICPWIRTESSLLLILLLIDAMVNTTMLVLNRMISRKLMSDIFGETDSEVCNDLPSSSASESSGTTDDKASTEQLAICLSEETNQSYTIFSNRFFSISSLELSTKLSLVIYITIYVSQLTGFYGVVRQRESLVITFTVISSLQVIFLIFGVVALPMILVPVCILRTFLLTISIKHCLTLSNRNMRQPPLSRLHLANLNLNCESPNSSLVSPIPIPPQPNRIQPLRPITNPRSYSLSNSVESSNNNFKVPITSRGSTSTSNSQPPSRLSSLSKQQQPNIVEKLSAISPSVGIDRNRRVSTTTTVKSNASKTTTNTTTSNRAMVESHVVQVHEFNDRQRSISQNSDLFYANNNFRD